MEFFNKKEEVMDIQLTSYGKELFSKGKFKPVYYSFFDEGILYDGARGDITEDQNDIQYRIKNTTPYMKNTAEFLSADQIAKRGELVPNEIDAREISLFDFDSSYENQLGASKNNSTKAPGWQISTLQSDLSGSTTFLTASATSRVLPIPQLNIDSGSIEYETFITAKGQSGATTLDNCKSLAFSQGLSNEFPDGTVLNIDEGVILLKVDEANTLSLKDNFEIEIFEIIEKNESQVSTTETKVLKPLKFFKFKPQIQNGIYLDPQSDFGDVENLEKIDETFTSNYLEVLIDDSVSRELVCKLDSDRKDDDLFIKDPIVCPTKLAEKLDTYDPLEDMDLEDLLGDSEEECE